MPRSIKPVKAWATVCGGRVYDIWFTKRDALWTTRIEGFDEPPVRVLITPVVSVKKKAVRK